MAKTNSKVCAAITIGEEPTLVVGATLGNVVRYSNRYRAGEPRHTLKECPSDRDFSLRTISLRPGSSRRT
jgi:hypothetical protein